jgi:hypothetical protein
MSAPSAVSIVPLPNGHVLVVVKAYDGRRWHDVIETEVEGSQANDVLALVSAIARVCARPITPPDLREAIGIVHEVTRRFDPNDN